MGVEFALIGKSGDQLYFHVVPAENVGVVSMLLQVGEQSALSTVVKV